MLRRKQFCLFVLSVVNAERQEITGCDGERGLLYCGFRVLSHHYNTCDQYDQLHLR